MWRTILLGIAGVAAVSAQAISIGGIGGAPFSDVVNNTTVSGIQSVAKSANFTVGPSIQVGLPFHLRLEVDALFRPYSFSLTGLVLASNPATAQLAAGSGSAQLWSFPALLQYRFGKHLLTPYAEGGLSFDHLAGLSAAAKSIVSGPGQLLHQSDASVVLGAGVDVKVPLLFRVSGELRYTRQTLANFASISNLNQAEVLVGIHF